MREFTGVQPLVGEIVGLRTFRVDDAGTLLPLYSPGAWYDGPNEAVCDPPVGTHRRAAHAVPGRGCECGFYAYGSLEAASAQRQCRYVLAVVSCWGNVVAGTQGFRAERARIDALWLAPNAAPWLVRRVSGRYPSVQLYADRRAMLAEHPVSQLDCYAAPRPHRLARLAAVVLGLAVLVLGLLPVDTLHADPHLWRLWCAALVSTAAVVLWLVVGARWAGHAAAAWLMCGVGAWLLAPVVGAAGWLVRLFLLRGAAVCAGGYLLALRPRAFPLESTIRDRPFCGVRPI